MGRRAFPDGYYTTVFEGEPLPWDPCSLFHVITAYFPMDQACSDEANQRADAALRLELVRRGLRHVRMTGLSPDRDHVEAGWAVGCSEGEAIELGRSCGQRAVFQVMNGTVTIVDCGDVERRDVLGLWSVHNGEM